MAKRGYFWFLLGLMIPILGAIFLSYYLYINNLLNINI